MKHFSKIFGTGVKIVSLGIIVFFLTIQSYAGQRWKPRHDLEFDIGDGIVCIPYQCKTSNDQNTVSWSFVAISDIHKDISGLGKVLRWVRDNKNTYNIKFVILPGDIGDKGHGGVSKEWVVEKWNDGYTSTEIPRCLSSRDNSPKEDTKSFQLSEVTYKTLGGIAGGLIVSFASFFPCAEIWKRTVASEDAFIFGVGGLALSIGFPIGAGLGIWGAGKLTGTEVSLTKTLLGSIIGGAISALPSVFFTSYSSQGVYVDGLLIPAGSLMGGLLVGMSSSNKEEINDEESDNERNE